MDSASGFNPIEPPANSPPRALILAELEGIAASGKVTAQPLKILRFIVTEALAGRAERLTENIVGESALGLDIARMTSLVRGHAYKLRLQLDDYYATQESWRVRVIIEIPKGAYRPLFIYPDPAKQFSDAESAALQSAQTAIDRLTLPALQTALDTLDEILKVHPDHPLVLAMKADVHTYRAINGLPPRREIEMARHLATRAVEKGPGMWQTHTTYGYVQAVLRNWGDARIAFEKAAAIPRPPEIPAHPNYIYYLVSQGELEEAIRLVKVITDSAKGYYGGLAPSRPIVRADLGFLQLLAGYVNEAAQTLDSAIKDSDFHLLFIYRSLAQEALNDPLGALRILRTTPIRWYETAAIWGLKGLFFGLSGSRFRARLELWKLQVAQKLLRQYVPASQFMIVYLGLGEHQNAIHYLKQVIDDCDPLFHWLGSFPFLRHIAHLPEFHAALKRAGLVWRWQHLTTSGT